MVTDRVVAGRKELRLLRKYTHHAEKSDAVSLTPLAAFFSPKTFHPPIPVQVLHTVDNNLAVKYVPPLNHESGWLRMGD